MSGGPGMWKTFLKLITLSEMYRYLEKNARLTPKCARKERIANAYSFGAATVAPWCIDLKGTMFSCSVILPTVFTVYEGLFTKEK